jgi:hypothetical protein
MDLQQIKTKYPNLFQRTWGLECGDGWIPIIANALSRIETIQDSDGKSMLSKIAVDQLKEKFGTMRFYYHTDNIQDHETFKKVDDIINALEAESEKTCELCGKQPATLRTNGWWSTQCDECHQKTSKQKH